jgi:hypothetical protein
VLSKDWALRSSLKNVIFESATSLSTILEKGQVDFAGITDIEFVTWDCDLDISRFPGFKIDDRRDAGGSVHLSKSIAIAPKPAPYVYDEGDYDEDDDEVEDF